MQSPRTRRQRLRLHIFFALALALVALGVMKALPYATFLVENADVGVVASDPNHGFSVGSVRWEVEQFSRDASLASFRRYFRKTCGDKTGTQAAICLSNALDRAVPFGTPKHEFLERRFDPAADFEAHLSGEPGHCVNRSSMVATTLLSVGIPARVFSFIPPLGPGGHTLVEVWTGTAWVVVDPTEVGLVGSIRPTSAAEVKHLSNELRLFNADGGIRQDPYPLSASVASGELVYPEPWLYTRIGPRFSFWPFRGKFIQAGAVRWRFSTPLLLCRVTFVISVFVGLYLITPLLYRRNWMKAAVPRLNPRPALDRVPDQRVRRRRVAS